MTQRPQTPKRPPRSQGSAPLPLDDQFCFALYGASMAVTRVYKPLLDDLGITYPQYLVLNALWERDGLSVGGLADRLSLEASTVTPLVKRLERAGLVERARNPSDERQVLVRLTGTGREMQLRSTCLGDRLVSASGMDLGRLRALTEEVRALRRALDEARNSAGEGSS